MRVYLPLFLVALIVGCSEQPPSVQFTTSLLFSDGAVLQRNTPVPVWGTASPGTAVTVKLNDQTQATAPDADGNWEVIMDAHEAGGPHTLIISTPDSMHRAEDVWFGDVWIASGQSNMEWRVRASANAEEEILAGNDNHIRHFKVPLTWSYKTEDHLAGGEWQAADSTTVGDFSAVGYYFARDLRAATGVPIGILNTSWGGSRVEAWLDTESQLESADEVQAYLDGAQARKDSLTQVFEALRNAPGTEDPGMVGSEAVWADPALDETGWVDMPAPAMFEANGFEGLSGYVWYRGQVTLTEEQAEGEATLMLSMIDDRDETYINGQLVGETDRFRLPRTYSIPEGTLQAGENLIAIRLYDGGGNGGILSPEESGHPYHLVTSSGDVALPTTWKFRIGQPIVDAGSPNQQPTLLYNKMVHPILSYPMTGFIWYQGESNGGNPDDAQRYAAQFQNLITLWRDLWDNDSAPFLFVSLANFRQPVEEPAESNWALLRESQSSALSLPNVGQAITIDIGEANDIHPRNKQDVGRRLALAARHFAYGEEIVYSGPIYSRHEIEGGEVRLYFDHVGGGLVSKDRPLGGFAIAGADSQFVWAEARIDGETVVVSSSEVSEPMAVRYAWADNPVRANLFNMENLPAAPFRTDQ